VHSKYLNFFVLFIWNGEVQLLHFNEVNLPWLRYSKAPKLECKMYDSQVKEKVEVNS